MSAEHDKLLKQLICVARKIETLVERTGRTAAGVQIILSVDEHNGKGETTMMQAGSGNFHARLAAADEWVRSRRAYEHGYHAESGREDAAD